MENDSKEEACSGCQDEGCKETDIGCQDAMCDFWSSWDEELQKVGKLLFPPSPVGSPPRGGDFDVPVTPITIATTELTKMMDDTPTTPTTSSTPTSLMDINNSSPIDDTSMIPTTTSQDATEKAIGDVDRRLNIGRDPSPIVIGRDPSIAVNTDAVEVTTNTPDSSPISLQGRVNAFKGRPLLLPRSTSVVTCQVSSHHSQLLSGTTICASRDYDDISTIGDPDMSSPNATNMVATATVADTAAATVAATTTTAMTVSDSTSSGLCATDPSKVPTHYY